MRSWIAVIILLLGTIACGRPRSAEDRAGIEKEKIANEVIRKVATQLKKETKLSPCGTMGQMLNEIQKLGLTFYSYEPLDIVEGRKLLVKSVDAFLQEVNKETRIHPYLIRYPFAPRNIEIRILVRSPDGKDVSPGALWGMQASDGDLFYKIDNPETNSLVIIYQETYNEALQRIEDPSLPPVPFEPDSKKISAEELSRLRKGISFVDNDGVIWRLDENGCWIKDHGF